jgi:hypothetical protein
MVDIYAPSRAILVIEGTAGETLSGHRVVRPRADGMIVYADPADPIEWRAGPWWLTQGAVMEGAEAQVLVVGEILEPSWSWTPGARIFLGAVGVLTTTPPAAPSRIVQVGTATGADTMFFYPRAPIETV